MRSTVNPRLLNAVFVGLLVFDITITMCAFFAPDLWFRVFHGVPYDDPEGFLRRCGANWAAFALFQAIALIRWKKEHFWIAVVAGMRLSDIFTDMTYLAFAADITPLGAVGLAVASPLNMVTGWWLLRTYRTLEKGV